MNKTTEYWKPVPGYLGRYEISDQGNVRALDYNKTGQVVEMKKQIDRYGYVRIGLSINGKQKYTPVHRMVATAFIENPSDFEQVNHKDGDKQNNHRENLEWCDNDHNQKHAANSGLRPFGESHGRARITEEQAKRIIELGKSGVPTKNIAKEFRIGRSTVHSILTGRNWRHLSLPKQSSQVTTP